MRFVSEVESPSDVEIDIRNDDHNDDESSMGDGGETTDSNSETGMSARKDADDNENEYFAKQDNLRVRRLKVFVFGILFVVAVGVCLAVYFVTSVGQQDEFELSFDGAAERVIESFENVLKQRIAAVTSFGVAFTSYAMDQNLTWPFVTMDNFQERATSVRTSSKAAHLQLIPIVTGENEEEWNQYSVANAQSWITKGREFQKKVGYPDELNPQDPIPTTPYIYSISRGQFVPETLPPPFFPNWQESPVQPRNGVNFNALGIEESANYTIITANTGKISLGGLVTTRPGTIEDRGSPGVFSTYFSLDARERVDYGGEPLSLATIPVMDSFEDDRKPVALLVAILRWKSYFEDILSESALPVNVILENTCEGAFTYRLDGADVSYLGAGNQGDKRYEDMAVDINFDSKDLVFEKDTLALEVDLETCEYKLTVYPTSAGDDFYNDNFPIAITCIIAASFLFTVLIFLTYDVMVERRQRKILDTAKRSTAIVSSIYPKNVRDKIMGKTPVQGNATKLRTFVGNNRTNKSDSEFGNYQESTPIADLFPECTVMFADVEGFTAWSSVREPSQVFTLLETLYAAFDKVASRRGVFKVETIGDCYLAVCGLPKARADHAGVMSRFARDCIQQMIEKTKELEVVLGPETGDLRLRVGLHSGPVTAGVLRGERSRFQLFGDTVNTASRIETSGAGNQIHVSETTSALLIDAGYENWVFQREGTVHLKGKGEQKTYWVVPVSRREVRSVTDDASRGSLSTDCTNLTDSKSTDGRRNRFTDSMRDPETLISWTTEILLRFIRQVVASHDHEQTQGEFQVLPPWQALSKTPMGEVTEIIELPEYNKNCAIAANTTEHCKKIALDPEIPRLVKQYVTCLSQMYHDNPFHNFEHASHVTMSVAKLMSRIIAPSDMDYADDTDANEKLHDHTYGITSDPLTRFACVFSALIHDVDHQGVSNTSLTVEKSPLVVMYGGKSMAEQNSIDQAWELLMAEDFQPLVAILCRDSTELARFRQLVVNAVLATDIMDPDLKTLRNERWEKAFSINNDQTLDESIRTANNRKATIVIEHLLQASDVSHTMQHWNVYKKWNSRLFKEMYKAYLDGRGGAKNPADFWAKGEIGFFDFYVIPLAKKLKDCGVFGVSSDEFLNYAQANRAEWEQKGERIVAKLVQEVEAV